MVKVILEVNDAELATLEELRAASGVADIKALFNSALTLYAWATREKSNGRAIASIDEATKSYKTLEIG